MIVVAITLYTVTALVGVVNNLKLPESMSASNVAKLEPVVMVPYSVM